MSSTVTIEPRTGTDAYNKPTYGTAVTYRAHLSRKRRILRSATGDEIDSGQTIYLDTAVAIETDARITLSTGDVGSTETHILSPAIKAVERRFDGAGAHHVLLYME